MQRKLSSPIVKLAHNAITAKLYDADRDAKLRVSSLLSYRVEGAEHMAAFKNRGWDGRSSFFDFRSASFPAGFVTSVYNDLTSAGYTVKLVRKPFPTPLGPDEPRVDNFPLTDGPYSYQWDTVKRLERHGQMIAQVATGGGKSRIAKLAYARIQRPTLFLTTRSVLMHQMKDAFERDLKVRVGIIGEGEWKPTRGMNVGMVQSLAPFVVEKNVGDEIQRFLEAQHARETSEQDDLRKRLKRKRADLKVISDELATLRRQQVAQRPSDEMLAKRVEAKVKNHNARRAKVLKMLAFFEFIILEEAHEAGGNGYYELLRHCPNAHYRLSLTATPFMRADEESNMRLMACSGPIGIRVSEKRLIDLGILARPIFRYITPPKPPKLYRTTPWQRAYKVGIVDHHERNRCIVVETRRAASHGLTTMVLVQHTRHGTELQMQMRAAGLRVEFIYGKHEQAQRAVAIERLAEGSIDVLIGSTILDVGVDVPAVGMIVLAGGGKAEVALRQRIGRGLRAKKVGPNICLVVDFSDSHNTHLHEHARQRRAIVENTPGFVEGILPSGQDFDFGAMGLTQVA